MSEFTGWPVALEFELRVEFLFIVPMIVCLCASLVFNFSLVFLRHLSIHLNFIHLLPWAHKMTTFLSLLAFCLGPCDSFSASGVWAGGYMAISGSAMKHLCIFLLCLPCLEDCGGHEWSWRNRHESCHGGELLWGIALWESEWVGARDKPLLSHLEQPFLNFNVQINRLEVLFKCRLWFSKVWVGCEILHF